MATNGSFSSKLDILQIKNGNYFENFLKSRLNWSKEKWDAEGEAHSKLHKLVNSMRYWYKKLFKAHSNTNIIVTVYNETRNAFITLDEIVDAILLLDKNIKITGYTSFHNPRYISLSFESKDIRDFVQNNLKMAGEHNVVFFNWAGGKQTLFIRLHWYPDDLDITFANSFLDKYFNITEESREETTLMNGMKLKSGIIYCNGSLKKDVNLDSVPHLVDIQGLECLLTIWGRKYLCLACNKVGHRARECPTPYCRRCKDFMYKNHDCNMDKQKTETYAQKLKGVSLDSEEDAAHEDESSSTAIICGNDDTWAMSISPLTTSKMNDNIISGVQNDNKQGNTILEANQISLSESPSSLMNLKDNSTKSNCKEGKKDLVFKNVSEQGKRLKEVHNFTTDCINSSEDEGSSEKVLTDLENHLLELNKLSNIAALITKDIDSTSNMEIDQSPLKRKLDLPSVAFSENSSRAGPRKTYSKKASKAYNVKAQKKKQ